MMLFKNSQVYGIPPYKSAATIKPPGPGQLPLTKLAVGELPVKRPFGKKSFCGRVDSVSGGSNSNLD